MTIYTVQTFYGSEERHFLRRFNAMSYKDNLIDFHGIDPDLIEVYKHDISYADFNDMYIED